MAWKPGEFIYNQFIAVVWENMTIRKLREFYTQGNSDTHDNNYK